PSPPPAGYREVGQLSKGNRQPPPAPGRARRSGRGQESGPSEYQAHDPPNDADRNAQKPSQDHKIRGGHSLLTLQILKDLVVAHGGIDPVPAWTSRLREAGEQEADEHKDDAEGQEIPGESDHDTPRRGRTVARDVTGTTLKLTQLHSRGRSAVANCSSKTSLI